MVSELDLLILGSPAPSLIETVLNIELTILSKNQGNMLRYSGSCVKATPSLTAQGPGHCFSEGLDTSGLVRHALALQFPLSYSRSCLRTEYTSFLSVLPGTGPAVKVVLYQFLWDALQLVPKENYKL